MAEENKSPNLAAAEKPGQDVKVAPADANKDTSVAQPQQVAPQEGVQVGGLDYTENADGTRTYADQKVPVQTDPPAQQ